MAGENGGRQHGVPGVTSPCFKVGSGGHVDAVNDDGNVKLIRCPVYDVGVKARVVPDAVVDMVSGHLETVGMGQYEQSKRISAARDREISLPAGGGE